MNNIYQKIKSKVSIPKLNLALVAVIISFTAYTLFAPITPATYDKPIVANANSLVAGHTLSYSIHTCRRVGDGVVTTITRQLVPLDHKELQPISLSTDVVTNPARCQTSKKTLIIPFSTPAGRYKLLIRGVYAIIPLRKPITVSAQSDTLNIKVPNADQTIQDLIDANTLLQAQLSGQAPVNGSKSTVTRNTNGSSSTSTNTNRTTTSNTNNTTNNSTGSTDGETANEDTIQAIIKALGGSPINPIL